MKRLFLIALMLLLVGCGRSSDQAAQPTRPPAEVIETTTGTARTTTPQRTTPTLVPTLTLAPTTNPDGTERPTELPAPPTETVVPPTPTGIATVTPLPTATATVEPTATTEPTATPEPTATAEPTAPTVATATTEPTTPGIDPLPGDFDVVPWQGLLVPIPDGYREQQDEDTGDDEINGAPIEARLEVVPEDSRGRRTAMEYTVVAFADGIEAWLDAVRDDDRRAIDEATLRSTTVAGYPAQSYEPQRGGQGRPLNYVVEVADDRLLLIAIDQDRPEQPRAIAALERDEAGAAQATPTIAPGGGAGEGEIAYLLDRDIWIHDLASGESRQLTTEGAVDAFAWSPDGRRIAFAAGDDDPNIWAIDVGSGKTTEITNGAEADMFPSYAPDGTLYFVRRMANADTTTIDIVKHGRSKDTVIHSEPGGLVGPTSFHVRDDDTWALGVSSGRGSYVLLGEGDDTTDLAETYLPSSAGCAYDIAWHDDSALVLSSIDCIPHENATISRIDLQDDSATPVTVHTGAGITGMDWSGDDLIAFSREETGSESDGIWVIDTSNTPRRVLEQGSKPRWKP